MIVATALRRRSALLAGPPTDVLSSPFTTSSAYPSTFGAGNPTSGSPASGTQIFSIPDDHTQIFVDTSDSQKTQVLQTAKAILEVLSGVTKGDKVPIGVLGKTSIVIGRDADPLVGDLRLQSTFVSRKHAEIRIEGDDLYLVDLGSSSGTRLNGERLAPDEKRKIEIGNEINFADVKVKLLGPD